MSQKQMLQELRLRVERTLSPYRAAHTFGVEEAAARLCALYCPEQEEMMRVAALLHDITKEYSEQEQREMIREHGISLRPDEEASPKIWHAITAAIVAGQDYPQLADEGLCSAIRWHTTGRAGMTLTEALLYLADYIEEGRTHAECVALREAFWAARPQEMDMEARCRHLNAILLHSLETTLQDLHRRGKTVCLDTAGAYEYLKTLQAKGA